LTIEARTPAGAWRPIVRDISLTVRSGEVVALIGESGAGKSTLGLAALGYARPGTRFVKGEVRLRGSDVIRMHPEQRRALRGRHVAYVAQSAMASLNPALPIGEQVAEPLIEHSVMRPAEARQRAVELMALLRLPEAPALSRRFPHEVSGGQQQRVMIAMALACRPELLILDEPTTALDVTTQVEVLKAITEAIRMQETAAVYVSHDLAVVAQIADSAVVMLNGEAVEHATMAELLQQPQHAYTNTLLGAVSSMPRAGMTRPRQTRKTPTDGDPILEVQSVCAGYRRGVRGARPALRDVDLSIRRGEVVALVGESGSGKSTLARVVSGLLPPWSGTVRFAGRLLEPGVRQRSRDQQRRIQIVFQSPDTTLNPEERVADAIGRPLQLYFGFDAKRRRQRVEELLGLVGLEAGYAMRFPGELSGGQRQRVSLARAFAAEPDLILCDEVLSALDSVVAASVLELLRSLQRRLNVACLFISHDLATVASIADRVVVLHAGKVCDAGPTERVFSAPHHPYTELLLASIPELRQHWLDEVIARRDVHPAADVGQLNQEGCTYFRRCPLRIEGVCDIEAPPRHDEGGHAIYCHRESHELSAAQAEPVVVAQDGSLARGGR